MPATVLSAPGSGGLPWACHSARAQVKESWNALEAIMPDNPTEQVDVTAFVASHLHFEDVRYYSLKIWLKWKEDGVVQSTYLQHYRLIEADKGVKPHQSWGPLKLNRVDLRLKQLMLTLEDGTVVPIFGDNGVYLIHDTTTTLHGPTQKLVGRLSHHIQFHEAADLQKSYFEFVLDPALVRLGEGYLGKSVPPQRDPAAPDSSGDVNMEPIFRNDSRRDTTDVQVQLRQLTMIHRLMQQLVRMTAPFDAPFSWGHRYARLQGMVNSIILAHRARLLLTPIGDDLGRLD